MASDAGKVFHVIIVGAGTTGLLIAQGLKRAGISNIILERETAELYLSRPRDWGMLLHWGSQHIFRCLPEELQGRLRKIRCNEYYDATPGVDDFLPCYNGKTGELLFQIHADNPVRVSRKKMRELFCEGIDVHVSITTHNMRNASVEIWADDGEPQYGKKLVDIAYKDTSVSARFADGTEITGNILIGCDGGKSAVRRLLVGHETAQLTKTPVTLLNFTQTYTAEQALHLQQLHPMYKIAYYPDTGEAFWMSIQDVPDVEKPETWKFQLVFSWSEDPLLENDDDHAGRVRYIRQRAQHWVEPWKSAGLWVKDDTRIPVDASTYWQIVPWNNHGGRVTLAGDAAHAITPHRGQGLNLALQDAADLVEGLVKVAQGEKVLRQMIDDYDESMRARASKETQLSLDATLKSHDWKMLMDGPAAKMGAHQLPDD